MQFYAQPKHIVSCFLFLQLYLFVKVLIWSCETDRSFLVVLICSGAEHCVSTACLCADGWLSDTD